MSDDENDNTTSQEQEEEEEEKDVCTPEVALKYQQAGDICTAALGAVMAALKARLGEVSARELCELGDAHVLAATEKLYKTKKGAKPVEKGLGFPTCVSVNGCICHVSPAKSDAPVVPQKGDLVHVACGAHLDGYLALVGTTTSLAAGSSSSSGDDNSSSSATASVVKKFPPEVEDAVVAARKAGEVALKLMIPGNKNTQVTEAVAKVAASYGCSPVEGVLSHELKRNTIDGSNTILNKAGGQAKVEEFEFKEGQVFSIDIVLSTGEGKPLREGDSKCQVFKRNPEKNYSCRINAARTLSREINARFPNFPFALRHTEDPRTTLLGITEVAGHDLVHKYPVLFAPRGETIVREQFTVAILPEKGPKRISNVPASQIVHAHSKKQIEDEALRGLLGMAQKKEKTKKKNKKKGETKDEKEEKKAEN